MRRFSIKIDKRELATILAALREWQAHECIDGCEDIEIADIATIFNTLDPLSEDEIDILCMRLNCS